jgi:hypothetical protein
MTEATPDRRAASTFYVGRIVRVCYSFAECMTKVTITRLGRWSAKRKLRKDGVVMWYLDDGTLAFVLRHNDIFFCARSDKSMERATYQEASALG